MNRGKIKQRNIKSCNNSPIEIIGIRDKVISKVPVILGRAGINVTIKTIIRLMEDIGEIQSVDNKLIIDKARVLNEVSILNIKGKIKKTIYYTQNPREFNIPSNICNTKHFIVYIPFETDISINLAEIDSNNIDFIQDRVYCEPICSKIVDHVSLIDNHLDSCDYYLKSKLINIVSFFLKLDILQDRLVNINTIQLDIDYTEDGEELEEKKKDSLINNLDNEKNNIKEESNKFFIPTLTIDNKRKRALLAMLLLRFVRGF